MRPTIISRVLCLAALATLVPVTGTLEAQEAPLLVTTDWLAEEMTRGEVVVLHVGSEASFAEAHIPGARPLPLPSFAPEVEGMSTEMPEPEALRAALEAAGVSSDSRIVIYSAAHPPQLATRLFLTLDHFGLGANASLLDGGLRAWQAEERPTGAGAVTVEPGSLPELAAGSTLLADHAFVSARVADGAAKILDARDPQFWSGAEMLQQRAQRPGRVPGALNLPFRNLVDDSGRLLEMEALRALFTEAGVEAGEPVVTYCHVGQQASLVAFAARLLGHEVRVYDGSYEEWSARLELPVQVD